MVTHCAGDIVNALNGVSSDEYIQCDRFSQVQTMRRSRRIRFWPQSDSTCSGTVTKSLLECLQTPKCSELSIGKGEFTTTHQLGMVETAIF